MDRRATGPAHSLALGINSDDLGADLERRVLEASSPVIRVAQNRPLFAAVLTGSLALHVFTLFLLNFLERASPIQPDTALEIPVELVNDPAAAEKKGGKSGTEKAKAAQPTAEAKPDTPPPKSEQAAKSEPPARPPAPAEKQAEAKPASQVKPPEPPKAEPPKPAATQPEPPKPAAAQAQPPKSLPQTTASAETPKSTPPQPAATQTAQPAPAPAPGASPMPTMAALQQQAVPEAGGQSPYGLMPDNWRAVAVPTPSENGDQEMSYKTIVFGMLELAKQFPEDARARGAHGSALIQFELNDDGTVKSLKLLRSSGDASLDVESLALVERASPFPKPPPGAQKSFAAVIEYDPDAR